MTKVELTAKAEAFALRLRQLPEAAIAPAEDGSEVGIEWNWDDGASLWADFLNNGTVQFSWFPPKST